MNLLVSGAKELGIELTTQQLDEFKVYFEELVSWNKGVNLTAITDYDGVQIKHFLDSLSLATVVPTSLLESGSLVDIGAGAGFPGLPLKITFPNLKLTLVESVGKKTAFLQAMVSRLGLANVTVLTSRAEDIGQGDLRESFDISTSRAVARLNVLTEYCLPLTRVGGYLVAPKKGDIVDEVHEANKAIESLGGHLDGVRTLHLIGDDEDRSLVVISKIAPTPDTYPRRAGIPSRRPLK